MQSSPFSGNVRHGPRFLCGDLPQYRATCDPPSSLAKSRRFLNEWNGNCCSKLLTFGIRTAAAPQSESPVMRGSLRVRIHYNSQTFTNGSRSRFSGARGWGAWETPGSQNPGPTGRPRLYRKGHSPGVHYNEHTGMSIDAE